MKPLQLEQDTPVIQKTKELCAIILEQPGYEDIKKSIVAFLDNAEARAAYDTLCDKQDELSRKHQQGEPITEDEEAEFSRLEQAFVSMPVAGDFINAQQSMHKIEQTVSGYVRKTFELGRVPTSDDFSSGCCGSGGCGCS